MSFIFFPIKEIDTFKKKLFVFNLTSNYLFINHRLTQLKVISKKD